MATITDLATAASVAAGDNLVINQGGTDRKVTADKFALLTPNASDANRTKRTVAAALLAGAGPFDIPYSAISAQMDLPTSFGVNGLFEVELFIVGTAQTGYGRITVLAYKSGANFGAAVLVGSVLSGNLAPVVTLGVPTGALRLTITGNSAITSLQYRVVG